MKLLAAALAALFSLGTYTPPTYTLVKAYPTGFPVGPGQLGVVGARVLKQSAMVVEAPIGSPPPTMVEFQQGVSGVVQFLPVRVPISLAQAAPGQASPGMTRWICTTPQAIVMALPPGGVRISALGHGGRSNAIWGRYH